MAYNLTRYMRRHEPSPRCVRAGGRPVWSSESLRPCHIANPRVASFMSAAGNRRPCLRASKADETGMRRTDTNSVGGVGVTRRRIACRLRFAGECSASGAAQNKKPPISHAVHSTGKPLPRRGADVHSAPLDSTGRDNFSAYPGIRSADLDLLHGKGDSGHVFLPTYRPAAKAASADLGEWARGRAHSSASTRTFDIGGWKALGQIPVLPREHGHAIALFSPRTNPASLRRPLYNLPSWSRWLPVAAGSASATTFVFGGLSVPQQSVIAQGWWFITTSACFPSQRLAAEQAGLRR